MKSDEITKLIEFVNRYNISEPRIENDKDRIIIKNKSKRLDDCENTKKIGAISENENVQEQKEERNIITSPLVGIFYSASSPESEDYVKVGDYIEEGQTLGLIEAMKLMNEINSNQKGVIREIMVKNGEMVEYNQPLFAIE